MLGFTTPAIGPTPPVSWLVASGIWPSSTSFSASAGVPGDALEPQRASRARRASGRTSARGSIGGPAWRHAAARRGAAEISEAGTTSTTSGRAAASRATASASVCSAAFIGGDAKSSGSPVQSDRRSQPGRPSWTGVSEGGAPGIRTLGRWASTTLPTSTTACGVACLARLDGQPAHETISRAIETLDNLEHRGAEGADAETGDGAGILVQIPDAFLRAELDFALPPAGELRGRGLHAPARGRPARRRPRP